MDERDRELQQLRERVAKLEREKADDPFAALAGLFGGCQFGCGHAPHVDRVCGVNGCPCPLGRSARAAS